VEFTLEKTGVRQAMLVASALVSALLTIQAGRIWLAWSWIHSQRPELMERGAALEPGNADAWDRLGRFRLWNFANPDPSLAVADFQRAVQNDPRTAEYWMDLASAYETTGDVSRARNALEHAKNVYPISAEVAWNYGNFLLRQQEYAEAFQKIQQAVRTDPALLPLAISRTWRSNEDVNQLLNQVLPPSPDAYFQALDFFQSIHVVDPGLAVWQRVLTLGKPFALPRAFPFLEELIREDRAGDARRVWQQALAASGAIRDESADQSLISDGGFAHDFVNGGLGWRWNSRLGVAISFDSASLPGGNRSVRLDFSGGTNPDLDQPSQYVPVEPDHSYHFHGYLHTEGITTESGMRFSITDPHHAGAVNLETENFTGSHSWTPVDVDLTTGPDTRFLIVRLFRPPSRLFENKLSGTAWIADLSLIPSGPKPGQTLQ
jgi:tetratricopeptide (TPR) repeat protein